MNVALKEWASVCAAIEAGTQILLLRKGGIVEAERGGFQVRYNEFLLFPTFEHQHRELLKPGVSAEGTPASGIRIATICRVTEVIPHPSLEELQSLSSEYVWNDRFLQMRFNYKPELPLYLLLLRAYRLPSPVVIPDRPSYAGCKSWVHLTEEIEAKAAVPVLDAASYQASSELFRTRSGVNLPTMG